MKKVEEFIEAQIDLLYESVNVVLDVRPLLNDYLKYDTKELIIGFLNQKKLRAGRVQSMLVGCPELWHKFDLADWKYIIEKVDRTSEYRNGIDHDACFEDIRFLYKYIEIDSIKLYKEDTAISKNNMHGLNTSLPKLTYEFIRNEHEEKRFLAGRYYFTEMKKKLISQGVQPAQYTSDAVVNASKIRAYISSF